MVANLICNRAEVALDAVLLSRCQPPWMSHPRDWVFKASLLLWNQTRQQWTANKTSQNSAQVREPKLSWNASYENLLGTSKPFPQPIPLTEMVEFLVDIWELEGLYD
ncbi:hypothetical protein RHSIM_Rhsim07G0157600 [Rhododendron simsii]|uniref:Gag1-like clamp domain-containing protein n=1 Tax=Rhododendron simsii TaxID=118357 RepID=A0A834GPP3_RHOSS|nr:hypothetical protein RHSIM_Rhsim07G0157600 [Rhododendron simsii]